MTTAVANRERKRREPFFDHVRYVRHLGKGFKVQLRWWLTGYGSVNLGLYERALCLAVRRKLIPRTQHHPNTPLGLWRAAAEVLAELRAIGVDGLPDVLPMYVKRAPGGGYRAEVRREGRTVAEPGPFETPEGAHLAMVARLAREFPGWQRHLPVKKPRRKYRRKGEPDGVPEAA